MHCSLLILFLLINIGISIFIFAKYSLFDKANRYFFYFSALLSLWGIFIVIGEYYRLSQFLRYSSIFLFLSLYVLTFFTYSFTKNKPSTFSYIVSTLPLVGIIAIVLKHDIILGLPPYSFSKMSPPPSNLSFFFFALLFSLSLTVSTYSGLD